MRSSEIRDKLFHLLTLKRLCLCHSYATHGLPFMFNLGQIKNISRLVKKIQTNKEVT